MLAYLKEKFHRFGCRVVASWHNKPFEEFKICSDDAECLRLEKTTIYGENETTTVSWDSIDLVWVFKRDLFTVDRISMLFKDKTGFTEINEDMEGWDKLLKVLPECLPGISTDWWADVAFPAFATNLGLIYKNPNGDQVELDEIIEDFESKSTEAEDMRPKLFWDISSLVVFFLTFPWPIIFLKSFLSYTGKYLVLYLLFVRICHSISAGVIYMRLGFYLDYYLSKSRIHKVLYGMLHLSFFIYLLAFWIIFDRMIL